MERPLRLGLWNGAQSVSVRNKPRFLALFFGLSLGWFVKKIGLGEPHKAGVAWGMTKKSSKSSTKASSKNAAGAKELNPQGVMATGVDHADGAHLRTVNNALVDHNYLTEKQFQIVAETLQRNLATTISLYLKFKKYHWDIRGRFFRDLHLAYDDFIDMFFPSIDEQAERLVALGGSPVASPADIEKYSVVKVPHETVRDARAQVTDLVADLTRVSKGYRDDSNTVNDDAKDPATSDLYNSYAATIDKIRWMLQAMLDDDRMN